MRHRALLDMDVFSVSTRKRHLVRLRLATLVAAAVLGGYGCTPLRRPAGELVRPVATMPSLRDDGDSVALAAAVSESARYFARLPPDRVVPFGSMSRTAAEMRAAMESFAAFLASRPTPAAIAAEIPRRFETYRATPASGVLFTGYYLPTLSARTQRDPRFRIPVLGRPPDLVTVALGDLGSPCACSEKLTGRVVRGALTPYPSRADIDAGAARDSPVLAWVDDAVGLFFLQIQGSGVLAFPDGSRRTIGFAASNGQPYVSIGKVLVDRGELTLDQASMEGIRQWIAAHPGEDTRLLQTNPRYVFFRPLDGPPLGSLGVPVTAGRTIATDPTVFPPGALAFVHVPATAASPELARLVLNQDAGAAIRGPGRVDVYFGALDDAAATAGRLRSAGELYFLAPRASHPR
jgi:membrane-bound lytic murein transglycosylase A